MLAENSLKLMYDTNMDMTGSVMYEARRNCCLAPCNLEYKVWSKKARTMPEKN